MLFLLPGPFRDIDTQFALSFIVNKVYKQDTECPVLGQLNLILNEDCLKRLDWFTRNQCEFSMVVDVFPTIALLYFLNKIPNIKLKAIETAALLGVGVQRKHPSLVAEELGLDASAFMTQVYSLATKMYECLNELWNTLREAEFKECTKIAPDSIEDGFRNIALEVDSEVSAEIKKKPQETESSISVIDNIDLSQFIIKGMETDIKINK